MSNYTPSFDGASKDALPTGDPGKAIQGSLFDAEFEVIATAINSKADASTVALINSVPTGVILSSITVPSGWVECNNQELAVATYPELDAICGPVFGRTNGSGGAGTTHFRVPDLQGRVIAGYGSTVRINSGGVQNNVLADVGGDDTHLLTANESGLRAHNHSITATLIWEGATGGARQYEGGTRPTVTAATNNNAAANAITAHNNVQPTMVLRYIIKT